MQTRKQSRVHRILKVCKEQVQVALLEFGPLSPLYNGWVMLLTSLLDLLTLFGGGWGGIWVEEWDNMGTDAIGR